MLNIMLTGVGGQGTVLAAKILAQAAEDRGWQVRTAETIGMAQRGGSVVSHVRMDNKGEIVQAPLIAQGTADIIIAFEPAEGARMISYLSPDGVLVTASTGVQPVTAALSENPYAAESVLRQLRDVFSSSPENLVVVDERDILAKVGNSRVLNTVLLARALATGHIPLNLDDLRHALMVCVKQRFVDLNLKAVDAAVQSLH